MPSQLEPGLVMGFARPLQQHKYWRGVPRSKLALVGGTDPDERVPP